MEVKRLNRRVGLKATTNGVEHIREGMHHFDGLHIQRPTCNWGHHTSHFNIRFHF